MRTFFKFSTVHYFANFQPATAVENKMGPPHPASRGSHKKKTTFLSKMANILLTEFFRLMN